MGNFTERLTVTPFTQFTCAMIQRTIVLFHGNVLQKERHRPDGGTGKGYLVSFEIISKSLTELA